MKHNQFLMTDLFLFVLMKIVLTPKSKNITMFCVLLPLLFMCVVNAQTNTLNYDNTLVEPLCMPDFMALNLGSSLLKYTIVSDCYAEIPNRKYSIKGNNILSYCFIDDYFLRVNKNNTKVSRCGQWLEVVGPSQVSIVCMVSGSITPDVTEGSLPVGVPFVALPKGLYTKVSGGFSLDDDAFVQATVAETDFDLKVNPTLWVLNKSESEIRIQVTDCNRPYQFIEVEKINYKLSNDDTFTLPLIKRKTNINLVSFKDEKLTFEDIELDKITSTVANGKYDTVHLGKCTFVADNIIYSKTVANKIQLSVWLFYKLSDSIKVETMNKTNMKFVSDAGSRNTSIVMLNTSPIIIQQQFKELILSLKANFDVHFKEVSLYLVRSGDDNTLYGSSTTINKELKFKTTQNGTDVTLRALFDTKSWEFGNTITLTYVSEPGGTIELIEAMFDKSDTIKKVVECNSTIFDCLNTECTVTNMSIDEGRFIWQKGCEPVCGNCRDGYVCTTMGRCIHQENNNLREGTTSVLFFLVILCILFVI
ncbi:hypothetical protein EIN_474460 [Entamoeba invadens IP1]|uniref:Uncharacterized protein n=1 Tax=Entamoeba invadens IP1 TaxID=370355 RepID=A0A0A1U3P2_ENTIV|nr:hypothetical protein EIN_474460 [Entamoeba invadens IP1]ELP88844.1 hypothetical protein EIN_474460 [Entamoeba invadens IP1]|eukprot:XP_004255615.1 hypothetical protein EIN_474460 [Entamoeba invadens IP1]